MPSSTTPIKMPEPKNDIGEPLADPEGAKVDIVFVHGLGGDRIGTWTWAGKDEDGKEISEFWPRDFLPKDCPTARILSFGYNAHFAHFYHFYGPEEISEELTINDHSTSLFQKLIGLREQTKTPPERPIIFVCHSLGGLVVANALSQNYRELLDEKSTNLSLHTIGTLFLGTPFGGSNAAKYGSLALNVFKLVSRTQKDSMENLVKRSEKLESINDAFAKLLKERDRSEAKSFIEVATFVEEYPYKAAGIIVPKESAKLLGFDLQSIAANHVDMTKFEGPYMTGYKDISNKLSQWIAGLDMTKEERKKVGLGNTYNVTQKDITNNGGNVVGIAEPNSNLTGTSKTVNIGQKLTASELKDLGIFN